MPTIVSSHPETSIWSASSAPLKLHSRAREAETACCAGVTFTKSLERIEIPQCIYDSCDGLGLFSQDPIGFAGGDANLYRYVGNSPTTFIDPTGLYDELPSEVTDRLREIWTSPSQSWSDYWDGDTTYRGKINAAIDELVEMSGNSAYNLQVLVLEGGKTGGRNRYTRLLGQALVEKSIRMLACEKGISFESASEEMLRRSREYTGSYNYGTEMRIAAAHGSKEGPIVAAIAISRIKVPPPSEPPMVPQYSQQQQGNGSYVNRHQSGKVYIGKGGPERMEISASQKAKEHGDPVVSKTHTPASDKKQSFIDEQNCIEANGGPGGNTYNIINSPGKKLRDGK